MLRHPTFRQLNRYADGELGEPRRARVAGHLAGCARCRGTVSFVRELREAARTLPVPALPQDALDRIRARRAAGERVILPLADPQPARPTRIYAIAATLALLLAGAVALLTVPELEAEKSELLFFPENARPGELVRVDYRSGALLRDQDRLLLRGRFRTAGDPAHNEALRQLPVSELAPVGGGLYRGSFRLPETAVYGVFAVEDPAGERLDSNGRRLWDLLIPARDGRPAFDALKQRSYDLIPRNWELAFQTAQELRHLYPERAFGWYLAFSFEQAVRSAGTGDSLTEAHRSQFQRFHRQFSGRRDLPPDELASMFFYAVHLGDSAAARYWRERLAGEAPASPAAVQDRAVSIVNRNAESPASLLEELEQLWSQAQPQEQLVVQGLSAARQLRDPRLLLRWADRYQQLLPWKSTWVGSLLMNTPELRAEGERRLRRRIEQLRQVEDEARALDVSVAEYRARSAAEARAALAALGEGLLAADQPRGAVQALESAVATEWDARSFRKLAEARLLAGDTSAALEALARASVDPSAPRALEDSARLLAGRHFDARRWAQWLEQARLDMRSRILARATARPVRHDPRLQDALGNPRSWSQLTGEAVTVVAFWSRFCAPALWQLEPLERLHRAFAGRGIRLLTITAEPPSFEMRK
ncbi:MAG: zf-HC2 domain-containing protein, partial [Gemmatimonadetes bacterium]|nr:zf-HC2 domain-containing protein [Gemmatimonadota bacterium]